MVIERRASSPSNIACLTLRCKKEMQRNKKKRRLRKGEMQDKLASCKKVVTKVEIVSHLKKNKQTWHCKWFQPRIHKSVNYDCPCVCSPEKDSLRWHWLTFWQPERKLSSESSELWIASSCYKSLVVVLIGRRSRDVISRLSEKVLESWFTNLEQTPLNRCQQLPAPYKRLIADDNKTDKQGQTDLFD